MVLSPSNHLSPPRVGYIYDRIRPQQRITYFGGLLVLATGSLSVLTNAAAGTPRWLLAGCLFSTMFGVAPALYLPNSSLILKLAGRFSGTVMGINDCPGMALAAVWLGAYPRLLAKGGWAAVIRPVQLLIACSAVCTAGYLAIEAKSPTKRVV